MRKPMAHSSFYKQHVTKLYNIFLLFSNAMLTYKTGPKMHALVHTLSLSLKIRRKQKQTPETKWGENNIKCSAERSLSISLGFDFCGQAQTNWVRSN